MLKHLIRKQNIQVLDCTQFYSIVQFYLLKLMYRMQNSISRPSVYKKWNITYLHYWYDNYTYQYSYVLLFNLPQMLSMQTK